MPFWYIKGMEVKFHTFLISALDGVDSFTLKPIKPLGKELLVPIQVFVWALELVR
jgi:hypothetical protein